MEAPSPGSPRLGCLLGASVYVLSTASPLLYQPVHLPSQASLCWGSTSTGSPEAGRGWESRASEGAYVLP